MRDLTRPWAVNADFGDPRPARLTLPQRTLLGHIAQGQVSSRRGGWHDLGRTVNHRVKVMLRRGWVVKDAEWNLTVTPLGLYHLVPCGDELPSVVAATALCPLCGGDYGPMSPFANDYAGSLCLTCGYADFDQRPFPPRRPAWKQVETWCAEHGIAHGLDTTRLRAYAPWVRSCSVEYHSAPA